MSINPPFSCPGVYTFLGTVRYRLVVIMCLFYRMAIDGNDQEGRWVHVEKLLSRNGPYSHADFEPGPDVSIMYNTLLAVAI
jgi:hypothetical protein